MVNMTYLLEKFSNTFMVTPFSFDFSLYNKFCVMENSKKHINMNNFIVNEDSLSLDSAL